jgi:hypothetical protein
VNLISATCRLVPASDAGKTFDSQQTIDAALREIASLGKRMQQRFAAQWRRKGQIL